MQPRRARILVACVFVPLVAACSTTQPDADPEAISAAFTRSLAGGQATFVLTRAEDQRADPILTFDHTCQGVHYQDVLYDTLVLWPNGRARRGQTVSHLTDGNPRANDHLGFTGTWSPFNEGGWYYYSSGAAIVVSLAPDSGQKGSAYQMPMRIGSDGTLSDLATLGGSCAGSPSDGREAEFTFTRR